MKTLEEVQAPQTGTWQIDPAHSSIEFVARHLMFTKVRGGFRDFSGTIEIGETPEDSRVNVQIQAESLDSGEEKRDGHVRSPDFLDVENFPQVTFASTKVERSGDRGLKVDGELKIKDVTRPVTLEGEFVGLAQDPMGNTKAAFSARTKLDREDFGITWNQALEAGGVLVGKTVDIELEVQAALAAAEQAA